LSVSFLSANSLSYRIVKSTNIRDRLSMNVAASDQSLVSQPNKVNVSCR